MARINTCIVNVGRLMEIDVANGYHTVEDVDAMIALIGRAFAQVPAGVRAVIIADWSACTVFSQDVALRARAMLSNVNPRVERSAILHRPDQATSVMQVFRLIKESAFDDRRLFTDP